MINIAQPDRIVAGDDNQFDFVRNLELNEKISIEKQLGGGTFRPGTIQYFFTYSVLNGQESNIFYSSPLYYTSTQISRADSPDEISSCRFNINIQRPDTKFDFLNIYAIQWSSVNVPTARHITRLSVSETTNRLQYTDVGEGALFDVNAIPFIGGKEIIPQTIQQLENTLFLANYTINEIDLKKLQQDIIDNPIPFGEDLRIINESLPSNNVLNYSPISLMRNKNQITT